MGRGVPRMAISMGVLLVSAGCLGIGADSFDPVDKLPDGLGWLTTATVDAPAGPEVSLTDVEEHTIERTLSVSLEADPAPDRIRWAHLGNLTLGPLVKSIAWTLSWDAPGEQWEGTATSSTWTASDEGPALGETGTAGIWSAPSPVACDHHRFEAYRIQETPAAGPMPAQTLTMEITATVLAPEGQPPAVLQQPTSPFPGSVELEADQVGCGPIDHGSISLSGLTGDVMVTSWSHPSAWYMSPDKTWVFAQAGEPMEMGGDLSGADLEIRSIELTAGETSLRMQAGSAVVEDARFEELTLDIIEGAATFERIEATKLTVSVSRATGPTEIVDVHVKEEMYASSDTPLAAQKVQGSQLTLSGTPGPVDASLRSDGRVTVTGTRIALQIEALDDLELEVRADTSAAVAIPNRSSYGYALKADSWGNEPNLRIGGPGATFAKGYFDVDEEMFEDAITIKRTASGGPTVEGNIMTDDRVLLLPLP